MLLRTLSALRSWPLHNLRARATSDALTLSLRHNDVNFMPNSKSFANKSTTAANNITKAKQIPKIKIEPKALKALEELQSCNENDVSNMCNEEPALNDTGECAIKQRVDLLIENQVTAASIINYPFLLTSQNLDENLACLKKLQPKNINDLVPMLKLQPKQLRQFENDEATDGLWPYLVYYLSERLKMSPQIVCKYIVQRPCLFSSYNKEEIIQRLELLLEYIDPSFILCDLSVLNARTPLIIERIERMKAAGIESPRPWLIKCTLEKFDRTIKNRADEKLAKGESLDVISFFAGKLNVSFDEARGMLVKYPQLKTCRFRRVSGLIDYLLNDAKYMEYDIIDYPRILSYSLETLKERAKCLEAIGVRQLKFSLLAQGNVRFSRLLKKLSGETIRTS